MVFYAQSIITQINIEPTVNVPAYVPYITQAAMPLLSGIVHLSTNNIHTGGGGTDQKGETERERFV